MSDDSIPMQGEGGAPEPPQETGNPYHWLNGQGLGMRLQCFLIVRDADDRIATVQLQEPPGFWWLPAETVRPNEDINECARRVSTTWFGVDLDPEIEDVITFQDDGSGKWYVLFVYGADAPEGDHPMPDDTVELRFTPAGKAPGPWAMGHSDVWALLAQ